MKKFLTVPLLLAATCAAAQQNPRLDSLLNEKDSMVVQQRINELAAGNEDDLGTLLRYYIAKKEEAPRDSLLAVIVEKYPMGWYAGSVGMSNILKAKGSTLKEEMFEAYRKKFPQASANKVYFSIVEASLEEQDPKKALRYLGKMDGNILRVEGVAVIAEQLMKSDVKTAESLTKKELETLRTQFLHSDSISTAAAKAKVRRDYFRFMKLYGKILMQRNDNAGALRYIGEAFDSTGRRDTELARDYALLLNRNGKYSEAFTMLDKIVRSGNGDAETRNELVIAYEKLNPGQKGESYLSELRGNLSGEIREKVAKILVSETAPAFEVKDVNGKTVSLADFKGKTIVLDFWATWCGPCKESFPAMQRTVNKYSKDPNVKFLFIHTWERTETPQQDAQRYLKGAKFALPLYMDVKDPATKKNPAVTMFGVKGIPAKFVIDGNGNVRFKVTGFAGGEDAAVDELSFMIDMAAGKIQH